MEGDRPFLKVESCKLTCRPGCEKQMEKSGWKREKDQLSLRWNMWEREEIEKKERESFEREPQPSRHSSRVCTTSLCDFYTRSDFLAAPLALARQIYVPWPYKSRAYKDIEAKPTRISHPIPCALLFSPRRSSSFSFLVAPSSRLPPYLVYPSFLPTASFHLLPFRLLLLWARDGIQEDEESKGLAHNRFSLFLVIALSDSLTTNCRLNNMLTCSI